MRSVWLVRALLVGSSMAPVGVSACADAQPPPALPPSTTATATASAAATDATPPPAATSATAAASSASAPSSSPDSPPVDRASKRAEVKHDPAWDACHASFKSTAAPEVAVAAMAKGCAAATKMKPLAKPDVATLDSQGQPRSYPLHVKAGKCYRVYGWADPGVTDLDVVLLDSTGATAGEDQTNDPSPVIAEDGAVCFQVEDYATVVTRVEVGKGNVALQVWSDE
jgi:hypothetical protein